MNNDTTGGVLLPDHIANEVKEWINGGVPLMLKRGADNQWEPLTGDELTAYIQQTKERHSPDWMARFIG